jgi:pyruvate,water dikinase
MTVETAAPQPIPLPPDFPAPWSAPEEVSLFWHHERMHFPGQQFPIDALVLRLVQSGFNANAQQVGLPIRFNLRRYNTFAYQAISPAPLSPEERETLGPRLQETLQGLIKTMAPRWEAALAEIKTHLAALAALDYAMPPAQLAANLDDVGARASRLFEIHFQTVVPMLLAMGLFDELHQDLFGKDAFASFRLLQGLPKKSVEGDHALWRLSRQALAMPAVRRVLEEQPASEVVAALAQTSEGRVFLADLRAYLDEYGQRGPDFLNLARPSWVEDPTTPIKMLQDMVGQPERDLLAEHAALAAEREEAIAEARQRLAGYPAPVVGQFEGMLAAAQLASQIQEDHNYWIDQRGLYQVRRAIVATGQHLADAGVLSALTDVYYLTWDEMRDVAAALPSGDRRALVRERRAEMDRFATVAPPPAIGTPEPPDPHANESPLGRTMGKFFGGPPKPPAEPGLLLGNAGSKGIAQGRARVVRSLAEAGSLERGEVLVCETTSPPWTSLFATAAAVVTDTGGILSHCAIVAREYQIPAVVGVGMATAVLRTGQLIEVDGTAGTVRVLGDE